MSRSGSSSAIWKEAVNSEEANLPNKPDLNQDNANAVPTKPGSGADKTSGPAQSGSKTVSSRPESEADNNRPTSKAFVSRPGSEAGTAQPTSKAMASRPGSEADNSRLASKAFASRPGSKANRVRPMTRAATTGDSLGSSRDISPDKWADIPNSKTGRSSTARSVRSWPPSAQGSHRRKPLGSSTSSVRKKKKRFKRQFVFDHLWGIPGGLHQEDLQLLR